MKLVLALALMGVVYCGWRIRQHRRIPTGTPRTALDEFEGLADAVEEFYGGKT